MSKERSSMTPLQNELPNLPIKFQQFCTDQAIVTVTQAATLLLDIIVYEDEELIKIGLNADIVRKVANIIPINALFRAIISKPDAMYGLGGPIVPLDGENFKTPALNMESTKPHKTGHMNIGDKQDD